MLLHVVTATIIYKKSLASFGYYSEKEMPTKIFSAKTQKAIRMYRIVLLFDHKKGRSTGLTIVKRTMVNNI